MSRYSNIPPQIKATLDASVARVRRILFLRGVCATLAVLVASVLAIMAIDAMVTIYASWIRWALWAAGVAGTCAVGYFALVKPLSRRFSSAEVAALIERNHPELEERLSTVVELAEAGDVSSSSRLMEEITKDAVKDAGKVSPRKEFTGRTIKPRLIAAAIALGILGVLFAAFPQATLRLVTRAIMPAAEVDNIYASSLKVAPGDQTVLAGTSLTVNLAVDGGFPSRAFVRTRPEGRGESVERMVRVTEEGAAGPVFYSFSYPQVDRSFTYRMSCGSALTRAYRVTVVPEPTYSNRVVEIVHPAYAQREPERYTNTASIVGLAGSKVKVSVSPSREGICGEARLPGDVTVPAEVSDDGRLVFSFDLSSDLQGGWSAVVWDDNGFTNQVETASVTVAKDTPPEITLVTPETFELKLPRTGSLPLEYEVKDDFGISRAVLEICVGAGAWEESKTIPCDRTGSVAWSGAHVVQLLGEQSKLKDSAVVRYRVKIEDNLPPELGGPGVARSPEVMVSIVGKGGASLGRQSLAAQVDGAKKDMANILEELRRAKRHFDRASGGYSHAENQWHRGEAVKASTSGKASAQNAEGLLSAFIEGLLDSRLETGAEMFRPVLDKHVTPVRQGAEDVFLLARWEEKQQASQVLVKDTDAAIKAFEEAKRKFDILTKAAEDLQRLEDLAEREKALAEMAAQNEIDAEDLAREEKKLADELKEEIKDDLEKNLDKQIEKAKGLQEKGAELEKRQDEIARAAEEATKNGDAEAQKAAAEAEKQLAKDIADLARDADNLAKEVEKAAGTTEMDEKKSAEGAQNAAEKATEAAQDAKDAADKLQNGDADGAKNDMQDVKDALSQVQQRLADAQERMGEKNGEFGDNAKEMSDMLQSMQEAIDAANAASEAEKQATAQQGEQQQGERQNGEPQQGDKQQGDQQQGEQQQGERQNGERQQGDQQQGQQQNQNPAMQNAAQKAQNAAQKMKNQVSDQAQKNNMPIDQFESPDQDGGESEGAEANGPQQENGKASKNAKPQKTPQRKGKSEGRKRVQSVDFGDDGDDDEWFKMKSESGTGAEVDSLDDVPAEYRGLVRDYFEALNKGGRKK